MASLYQRKHRGTWYAAFTLPDGKRLHKSMCTGKRPEAQRRAVAIEAEIANDSFLKQQEGERITIKELFEMYIERHSKPSKRSWSRDVTTSKAVCKYLGRITLSNLKKGHLADYVVSRRKDGVSGSTIRIELQTLRHAFKLAMYQWEYIKNTPFDRFQLPKQNAGRIRSFSQKEIDKIHQVLAEPMKPIFIMALNTGLRLSNIINLKWEQVDFAERIIEIPAEEFKNGKPHEVVMNKEVFNLLNGLKSSLKSQKVVKLNQEYVFLTHFGKPYTKDTASQAFRRALRMAKIKNARFHDTRHTFATELAERGATAQDLLFAGGWSDLKMVMRYTHRRRSRMRHVVGLLDK